MISEINFVHFFVGTIYLLANTISADDSTTTNTLVTINNPVNNQVLTPGQQVMVQYTVNGVPKNAAYNQITNYPNSLNMEFRWVQKSDSSRHIEFTALNGLNTDPYVTGLKNQVYSHRWKLPNCKFFRRYMPSDYSFTLIFTPEYPEVKEVNMTTAVGKKPRVVVPLGPQQTVITLPIDIYFNITLMDDPHHKGC